MLEEQKELLATLVEAALKVPRFEQQFLLTSFETDNEIASRDFIQGAGLPGQVRVVGNDVWTLDQEGFLDAQWNVNGSARFTLSEAAFRYYEEFLRNRSEEPAVAIDEEVRRLLESSAFRERFGTAYDRLSGAEELLWQTNPKDDLTTIGHKLRDAIQQFCDIDGRTTCAAGR